MTLLQHLKLSHYFIVDLIQSLDDLKIYTEQSVVSLLINNCDGQGRGVPKLIPYHYHKHCILGILLPYDIRTGASMLIILFSTKN